MSRAAGAVHPNQISLWKQEFIKNASMVFTKGKKEETEAVESAKLYEEIGRLKIENSFLKKRL